MAAGAIAATAETVPSVLTWDVQAFFNPGASVQVVEEPILNTTRLSGEPGVAGQSQPTGPWVTTEPISPLAKGYLSLASRLGIQRPSRLL